MIPLQQIVEEYLEEFPEEKTNLAQLLEQIQRSEIEDELYSRKNFVGHVTASGLIISRKTKKVLRAFHKTLGIHLQPGGHFEPGDNSPLDTAIREISEETGLSNVEYLPYHYNEFIPIDIDTHSIPANLSKREPIHQHHDFRYLFICDGEDCVLNTNRDEIGEYRWDALYELHRLNTFARIIKKIQLTSNQEFKTRQFFYKLTRSKVKQENANSIIVSHLLHGSKEYIESLGIASTISAILPKPKSIVEDVLKNVSKKYNVVNFTREEISILANSRKLLQDIEGKVVIFDIGGWFAPVINDLATTFPDKLIGVIEDTENGLQKYERQASLKVPILSVARSPLKNNEDFLIGQSILFSADALLRDDGRLIQYMDCSVIGYGKIGKSIAHHLLLRGVKPNVGEIDPIRMLEAYNQQCNLRSQEDITRNSDVIFCATGNHALSLLEFRNLKDGCFIFSVTSSDDELKLAFLDAEYSKEIVSTYITKYSSASNFFYLVNKGNAVNFIHKAVVGSFINLVRGEMICCYKELLSGRLSPGIHELEEDKRREIAKHWLEIFLGHQILSSE